LPVVVGAGVFLAARAHEGEMFGARDVVRRAAMQVAAGERLLIELDQLTGRQAFLDDRLLLGLRSVAVDDAIGGGHPGDLLDPLAHTCMRVTGLCVHPCIMAHRVWGAGTGIFSGGSARSISARAGSYHGGSTSVSPR